MNNFNDLDAIKKLDPQDTLGSTELAVKQFEAAWKEVQSLTITENYSDVKAVVFCGMGASIYGALVVKALEGANFAYPTEIVTDYHLPAYVDENTLIVLTSYSGSTEEVLSCAGEAQEMGAKMVVLTKGGKLAEFAKEHDIPAYVFDGSMNPAGVPRLGNGYSIFGLMGLLHQLGIITLDLSVIDTAIQFGADNLERLKKQAQDDVQKFVDTIPVIFAAEHLSGNAQILRNQFNETSKTFSAFYLVPDLNHHLMEGLAFPNEAPITFFVINSTNYSEKIKKRMKLTVDVVKQNNRTVIEYMPSGTNVFEDFVEVLLYGSYLTLYLGLYYDQNPAINPWVDMFKEKLAQ
ncbi:MAG TPA: SIS domain-containing protein [Candidatus Levybacteria bacterium]|nr:SIS domain-containing protein [Candidatus Levybacteria bacterium]